MSISPVASLLVYHTKNYEPCLVPQGPVTLAGIVPACQLFVAVHLFTASRVRNQ